MLLLPNKSARPHIPEGTPSFPTPLPLHTLRDGGQKCQVGGHIGTCQGDGEEQVEAAAKQEVERLRVEPGDPGRRESREWCRSEGAMLGSEEGPRWTVEAKPNLSVNEALFHHPRRLLLPPIFRLTRFGVLHPRCWCFCQFPPRKNLKACILNQSATPLDTLETSDGFHLQLCDHCVSAMSGCRSCTMRKQSAQLAQWALSRFLWALLNPNPPTEKLKLASTLAMSGAEREPRMVSRHVQTLASCCSAKTSVKSGSTRT